MIIPINTDSIGDPNQTPVVYIGEENGRALGIPERAAHPTGQVDLDEVRRRVEAASDRPTNRFLVNVLAVSGDPQSKADGEFIKHAREDVRALLVELNEREWQHVAIVEQWETENRRLLADLDAAREALRRAKQGRMKSAERLRQAWAERDELREHILDIDAHATPFGDLPEDPGYVGTYLVTAGALHRALGKIGHTAPKCQAEAERDRMRPVVEAAQAWRHGRNGAVPTVEYIQRVKAAVSAVDTFETQEGTDGS